MRWALLLLVACNPETAASASAECSSNANCTLGMMTAECCDRCKPFAATHSEVAELEAKCQQMSPKSGRCPEVECPKHEGPDYIAKCAAGKCVVGP